MEITEHIGGLYSAKLNLDIKALRPSCDEMYDIIKDTFTSDSSDYSGQSTLTTKLYAKYNFCLYPFPGIHELYWNIHQVFHECLTHFHRGRVHRRYFMQSWLNYYRKGDFIDWHSHSPPSVGSWHGFFCLDVEPGSFTSYKWPNDPEREGLIIDVQSQNNLMVMGLSNGDHHRSSEWLFEDRPRITIAFDIHPEEHIINDLIDFGNGPNYKAAMAESKQFVNHWIPI